MLVRYLRALENGGGRVVREHHNGRHNLRGAWRQRCPEFLMVSSLSYDDHLGHFNVAKARQLNTRRGKPPSSEDTFHTLSAPAELVVGL